MRAVLHDDVIAAALAVKPLPSARRGARLRLLFAMADAADRYRKRKGHAHHLWGNGSLMSVASKGNETSDADYSDMEFCRCVSTVLETLVAWRAEKREFNRLRN